MSGIIFLPHTWAPITVDALLKFRKGQVDQIKNILKACEKPSEEQEIEEKKMDDNETGKDAIRDELNEWQIAALQDLKEYIEKWNAFVTRGKEQKKMDDNEAGKQKEQSMTFTFKGPISWQWIQNTEKPYLSQFIVESSRLPIFEDVNTTNQPLGIDELISRHKGTLDLLAKPAQPEPTECGCLDKAGILYRLKSWKSQCEQTAAGHIVDENYSEAYRLQARGAAYEYVIDAINEGDFDRAPCKPEPAPERDPSWNATGLDFGTEDYVNRSTPSEPAPSKPALDKEELIKCLKRWVAADPMNPPNKRVPGYERILEYLDQGFFSLPATDRPREVGTKSDPEKKCTPDHTCDGKPVRECRCSTANLVEQLRARANLADGINITDLKPGQRTFTILDGPATVIAVRKEDQS